MEILRNYSWDCGDVMIPTIDIVQGDVSVSATAKTGSYSLQIYNGEARFPIDGTPANPSFSVWTLFSHIDYYNSNYLILKIKLGTGEYIELRWNGATHTLDAYVDSGLVANGSVILTTNDWFHVQCAVTIADAGTILVKINGHESINYSGDTQPGAATGGTYVQLRGGTNESRQKFDNLVIGSGGYLGDLRCIDIRPNADTAQDDWTPSAGDNYSTIDETPPSDADYNEINLNAQADELALGDFDGATYTPLAITAWARARMEAATGDSIKVGIDSNGVDDVTQSALSTAYEYYFHTNDENPDGPAAWDDAAIDALLLRYESVIA